MLYAWRLHGIDGNAQIFTNYHMLLNLLIHYMLELNSSGYNIVFEQYHNTLVCNLVRYV